MDICYPFDKGTQGNHQFSVAEPSLKGPCHGNANVIEQCIIKVFLRIVLYCGHVAQFWLTVNSHWPYLSVQTPTSTKNCGGEGNPVQLFCSRLCFSSLKIISFTSTLCFRGIIEFFTQNEILIDVFQMDLCVDLKIKSTALVTVPVPPPCDHGGHVWLTRTSLTDGGHRGFKKESQACVSLFSLCWPAHSLQRATTVRDGGICGG